jgi:hypothetical protein
LDSPPPVAVAAPVSVEVAVDVAAPVSVLVAVLVAAPVSVLVAVLVVAEPVSVAVVLPPSGVVPPHAVSAAAITTLAAARAIVWNLIAINLVRLLHLFGYACLGLNPFLARTTCTLTS